MIRWACREASDAWSRRPILHGSWTLVLALMLVAAQWLDGFAHNTSVQLAEFDGGDAVWAFAKPEADEKRLRSMLDRLQGLNEIKRIEMLSPQAVRVRLKSHLGPDIKLDEVPTDALPRAVRISPAQVSGVPESALAILRLSGLIEGIDMGLRSNRRARAKVRQLHLSANALEAVLLAMLLVMGIGLGRLITAIRHEEIAVFRLLGATPQAIALPLLIGAASVALLASFLALLLAAAGPFAGFVQLVPLSGQLVLLPLLAVLSQVLGVGLGMVTELTRPELEP
jgi:cell division protein FtsX